MVVTVLCRKDQILKAYYALFWWDSQLWLNFSLLRILLVEYLCLSKHLLCRPSFKVVEAPLCQMRFFCVSFCQNFLPRSLWRAIQAANTKSQRQRNKLYYCYVVLFISKGHTIISLWAQLSGWGDLKQHIQVPHTELWTLNFDIVKII